MEMQMNTKLLKIGAIGLTVAFTLGLGACATSSGGALASGAPITYKVDQGEYQTASLNIPTARPETPRIVSTPKPVPAPTPVPRKPLVSKPAPAPQTQISGIDQSKVDTKLYAHQRVGKTYTIMGKSYTPKHQPHYDKIGTASWYGDKFHGKLTASGEVYNMYELTAAHKTLPLNSMVYVSNLENGRGVMVRINDRGPFIGDRIIDLSKKTAQTLDLFHSGLARVRVQYAGPADPASIKRPNAPRIAPVLPRPKPKPNSVAEAPKYKSLRALPRPVNPQSIQPVQPAEPAQPYALPKYDNPLYQPKAENSAPKPVSGTPAMPPKPKSDAPITLTIKGPVHLAADKQKAGSPKARFIPAVNITKKQK